LACGAGNADLGATSGLTDLGREHFQAVCVIMMVSFLCA
jgi:hypothetical protein